MMKKLMSLILMLGAMAIYADDNKYMNVVSTSGTQSIKLSQVQKITFKDGNTVVSILNSDAQTTPLSTLQKITFGDKTVVRGDANNDSNVSMSDVMYIVTYILGVRADDFCTDGADVNLDGSITMSDVMYDVNFILYGTFPSEDSK